MSVVNLKEIENLGFTIYTYEITDTFRQYSLTNAPLTAKLPPLIRIEENQEKGNVKADYLIRGKYRTWEKTILTGPLPFQRPGVFFGDCFKNGKKSFLLIKVTPDRNKIQVLYFKGFMPLFPSMRLEIAKNNMSNLRYKKRGAICPPSFRR